MFSLDTTKAAAPAPKLISWLLPGFANGASDAITSEVSLPRNAWSKADVPARCDPPASEQAIVSGAPIAPATSEALSKSA